MTYRWIQIYINLSILCVELEIYPLRSPRNDMFVFNFN